MFHIRQTRTSTLSRDHGDDIWNILLRRCRDVRRETYMIPGAGRRKFFAWLTSAVVMHEVASNCMFVAQMAFFSRVSDPVIGGSYMTLLNTIANVGSRWWELLHQRRMIPATNPVRYSKLSIPLLSSGPTRCPCLYWIGSPSVVVRRNSEEILSKVRLGARRGVSKFKS